MTDHDGAHPVADQFEPPPVETRPLEIQPDDHTLPDLETLPDIHPLPDFETLPDEPIVPLPDGCMPNIATREELEMALRRAELVMEDCSTLLDPAIKAMEDGAWVSRRADEFSTGLAMHARQAGTIAESCVEVIQSVLDSRGDDDVPELRPL